MTEKMDSRFRGNDRKKSGNDRKKSGNDRREITHPHLNPPPSRVRKYKDSQ
jgi:hypothetical protein